MNFVYAHLVNNIVRARPSFKLEFIEERDSYKVDLSNWNVKRS